MTENDVYNIVREVLRQELAPISMATILENADQSRSKFQRTATDVPFPNARNIQPYGISSRAPVGTDCLAVPVGGNSTHMNVVGHFDKNKPSVNDGEVKLYNQFGQTIYLKNGSVKIGTPTALRPVPLGDVLKTLFSSWLNSDGSHTHLITTPGNQSGPPSNAAALAALKASPVDDGAMNSTIVFVP